MDPSLVFERISGQKADSLLLLKGGYSNRSYLVNGRFVLRLKEPSDPLFYAAISEKAILEKLGPESLAPLLVGMQTNGNLVDEYLAGYQPFLGPDTPKGDLVKVLLILEKVHATAIPGIRSFDLWGRYEYYHRASQEPSFPDIDAIKNEALVLFDKEEMTLCHNDVVRGNVLKNDHGEIRLVDFEFAGLNYPEFDTASLLSENPLNPEWRKELLAEAGPKVRLLVKVANRLWFYWAKWRYLVTKDEVFLTIAEEKKTAILHEGD